MKCDNCIHNDLTGCKMLDCIRHPDTDRYAVQMSTNTFTDRFMDHRDNLHKKEDQRR